jgi:hypothetical protein
MAFMESRGQERPRTVEQALIPYRILVEQFPRAAPILVIGFHQTKTALSAECDRDQLAWYAAGVRDGITPPVDWAMFSSEIFVKVYANDDTAEEPKRGELERRHEAGDGTIGDAIAVVCWDGDNLAFYAQQAFMRTSGGVIWGEINQTSNISDVEGSLLHDIHLLCGRK